jgi:hypothetical protein
LHRSGSQEVLDGLGPITVILLHAVSEVKLVSVRAAFLIVELLLAGVKAQLACVSDVVPLVGQDLPFDDRPLFVSQLVAL